MASVKPDRTTALICCAAGAALLLYALLGDPSYGYFQFMKIAVCGSALYAGWALHSQNSKLAPLSLALASLGIFEFVGKMDREDWAPWNWATVAAFGLCASQLQLPKVMLPARWARAVHGIYNLSYALLAAIHALAVYGAFSTVGTRLGLYAIASPIVFDLPYVVHEWTAWKIGEMPPVLWLTAALAICFVFVCLVGAETEEGNVISWLPNSAGGVLLYSLGAMYLLWPFGLAAALKEKSVLLSLALLGLCGGLAWLFYQILQAPAMYDYVSMIV